MAEATIRFVRLLMFSIWVLYLSTTLATVQNGVYKLRSLHRRNYKKVNGDCYLLKTVLNEQGAPSNLSFTGHCCHDRKNTDIKVVLNATKRGLEATFQWSYDNNFYLTAKRIGNPVEFEKIKQGSVNDAHRFILTSPRRICQDCVAIQSASTQLYLSTSRTGRIVTTTDTTVLNAWFDLYTCNQAFMAICNSTITC